MKLNKYISIGLVSSAFMLASCSDFLDMAPDQRTEITTPESVRKLLVSAYPSGNWATLGELSSDNMVDNNAPHVPYSSNDDKPIYYNLLSMEKMDDELFAFEPVTASMGTDSPSAVWQGCYAAIATANHALEAIAKFEEEGRDPSEYDASKGEALLVRAYNHFILVNLFSQAYKNDELSKSDLGIPYVTQPETTLQHNYERGSVTDVYQKIQKDLEEGLPLIDDANYTVAKYHFNEKAAHAFAARFYLFKRDYDKVIEHANYVLDGEDPATAATLMRDWTLFDGAATGEAYANVWLDYDSPSTLLFIPTYSVTWRLFAGGYRYAMNHEAAQGTLFGFGPSWTLAPHPCLFASGLFISGKQDYGLYSSCVIEKFEYTDKVSGIGYPHIIRREFTCEETLLCRAEAYLFKSLTDGDQYVDKAIADLKVWDEARKNLPTDQDRYFKELTRLGVRQFYTPEADEYIDEETGETVVLEPSDDAEQMLLDYSNFSKMGGTELSGNTEFQAYLNCVLHFRRLETIHDGTRFFDLKRYGIKYEHWIGKNPSDLAPETIVTLDWNDPRRALQLPQEVIAAGIQPNPTDGSAAFDLSNPKMAPAVKSFNPANSIVK